MSDVGSLQDPNDKNCTVESRCMMVHAIKKNDQPCINPTSTCVCPARLSNSGPRATQGWFVFEPKFWANNQWYSTRRQIALCLNKEKKFLDTRHLQYLYFILKFPEILQKPALWSIQALKLKSTKGDMISTSSWLEQPFLILGQLL